MSHKKTNRYNSGQGNQGQQARSLDDLAAFEDFTNHVLPKLRKAIAAGKKATDIYAIAEAELASRVVTMALTEEDPAKALAAIKEIFDRSLGKPKESMHITQKYEKLTDSELDALLASEEAEVEGDPDNLQ